jgi:dienelactone hydrolase
MEHGNSVFSLSRLLDSLAITLQFRADLQEDLSNDVRLEQATLYKSNMTLFVQRVQRAIDQVAMYSDDVSMDNLAIIGYCFGGTGVVQYGFSGATDAKVAVAFHGGLSTLPPVSEPISPYMLM